MNKKFYFRIWVVICGFAFAYGYVRRITLGEIKYPWEEPAQHPEIFEYYNWFDKIVGSIEHSISFGYHGLAFRITWGISTLIVVGLITLLLGLAIKWVRDSLPKNEKS
jgi:hypothetical protein